MKPQSIVLAMALLTSCAPLYGQGVAPSLPQDYQAKVAQGAARLQSRMAEGQQMMAFMPKLMRGQRLIELATARKCEWTTGVGTGVPQIPNT